MTDIKAGDEISKDWWPPAVMAEDGTDIDNITNTSYDPGTPVVSVTFTAPASGRVAVAIQGGIDQDSAEDRATISHEIYLGTSSAGTLIQSGRSSYGVGSPGGNASDELVQGNMSMTVGLTPGSTYYAQVVHQTEGVTNTNDITFRRIIVFPLP